MLRTVSKTCSLTGDRGPNPAPSSAESVRTDFREHIRLGRGADL
jgi:hypothetical protein